MRAARHTACCRRARVQLPKQGPPPPSLLALQFLSLLLLFPPLSISVSVFLCLSCLCAISSLPGTMAKIPCLSAPTLFMKYAPFD